MLGAMRVLVVQHEDVADLGSFEAPLRERGGELDVWRPSEGHRAPAPLEDYDAIVSLGSFAEPDRPDEHPWLHEVAELSRRAVDEGVPFLGVCLGAQVLAAVAGAQVERVGRPAFGWEPLEVTPAAEDDPLFGDLPPGARVFVWQEYGFRAPECGTLLARTDLADQAFRLGDRAWAVQFHPEVDARKVHRWVRESHEELAEAGVDQEALLEETARREGAYIEFARTLAERFFEQAEPSR